jgi:hypothetical protein
LIVNLCDVISNLDEQLYVFVELFISGYEVLTDVDEHLWVVLGVLCVEVALEDDEVVAVFVAFLRRRKMYLSD